MRGSHSFKEEEEFAVDNTMYVIVFEAGGSVTSQQISLFARNHTNRPKGLLSYQRGDCKAITKKRLRCEQR